MTPEQRAAELLPCMTKQDYCNNCYACWRRPAVAAALAEKDKETEYHKALYKQEHELALAQADIVIEANTEENKLQAEAAALRVCLEWINRNITEVSTNDVIYRVNAALERGGKDES